MEHRLHSTLELVNQWLRFAETKNAALLAANSAIVFGIVNSSDHLGGLPPWVKVYVWVGVGMIALSAAFSLLSFVPRTRLPWISSTRRPSPDDNLIFYGDIAGYDSRTYLEALHSQAGFEDTELSQVEFDLAEQIIINSTISLTKYRLFAIGVWLTLSVLFTPIVTIPLMIARR